MTTKALKVGRARVIGGAVFRKKTPFAQWLDEQPRGELTYDNDLQNPEGKGWTADDFAMEAFKRGVRGVRVQTTYKRRAAGSVPNSESYHLLKKAFPSIKF